MGLEMAEIRMEVEGDMEAVDRLLYRGWYRHSAGDSMGWLVVKTHDV